jgi:hypothetical protein
MQANFDWIWWTAGGVLALLGLTLLYWSLLHDRARGRRRCPKCWYDMSGTPGNLVCSECGNRAKRERKLFKTRRRWRWASVGLLLAVSAYPIARAPLIRRDGTMGWWPTTALILAVIWFDSPEKSFEPRWTQKALNTLLGQRMDLFGSNSPPPPDLWDWQWRLLISYSLDLDEHVRYYILDAAVCSGGAQRLGMLDQFANCFPIRAHVDMPKGWPEGVPLPFAVSVPAFSRCLSHSFVIRRADTGEALEWIEATNPVNWLFHSQGDVQGVITLPPLDGSELDIEFTVIPHVVASNGAGARQDLPEWKKSVRARVSVSGTLENWIRTYEDADLSRQIRDGFELRFRPPSSIEVFLDGALDELSPAGDIVKLELLRNGQSQFVGSDSLDVRLKRHEESGYRLSALFDLAETSPQFMIDQTDLPDGDWRFRVSFDRLAMLLRDPKLIQTCWPGTIEGAIDWTALRNGKGIREPIVQESGVSHDGFSP